MRAKPQRTAASYRNTIVLSLARTVSVAMGALSIVWTLVAMPAFWHESGIADLAASITAGETYEPAVMADLDAKISTQWQVMRPSFLGKIAIFRLRRSEEAIAANDHQRMDVQLDSLDSAVGVAIASVPSDPFMWLALYWLKNVREGFTRDHLRYLRRSYALGPNEAWIALRRSRLALAIFPVLPADLANDSVSEFVGLVRSGLFAEALEILTGPGWPMRDVLLSKLRDLGDSERRGFASTLHSRGLDDLVVPGIEPLAGLPWKQ